MPNRHSNSNPPTSTKPPRIPMNYRNLVQWGFLIVFVGVVVFVFDYHCPFKAMFSLPCPGCGMTRALIALLQGHLSLSIQWHAMLIPSLICLGLAILLWFKNIEAFKTWKNKILYTWIFLMFGYWIMRLIFVFPHSSLF